MTVHPMRGLMLIVEGLEPKLPSVFYHGTCSSRIEAIRRHGLIPRPSRDNPDRTGIYLTDDLLTAESYADLACTRDDDDGVPNADELVVLQIDASVLDTAAFEPDDYEVRDALAGREGYDGEPRHPALADHQHWSEVPWRASLDATKQVFYNRTIPPSAIQIMNWTNGK